MKCLVIGCVWPEPNSSAAGENMMALLTGACNRNWKVTFACAAAPSTHAFDLNSIGIDLCSIKLNCSTFDDFLCELSPDIVIFDRFMTEEQFGWRVSKHQPQALRILNTEDLHGLRRFTQLKSKSTLYAELHNDIMLREVAAVLRCDKTLVISKDELEWLNAHAGVRKEQLVYFPLLPPSAIIDSSDLSYESTQHVSFIGNFKHEPNWQTVLKLRHLWPKIRSIAKDIECHIYGAYPPKKATDLSNEKIGFYIKGWVDNANDAFTSYRLSVAPLTFGAGVKGKLLRAIANAKPSVVSEIAIQGIATKQQWPGSVVENDEQFIEQVISLYQNKRQWSEARYKAHKLYQILYSQKRYQQTFFEVCENLCVDSQLQAFRNQHLLTKVLNHQTLKSHQYMSQWISEKNKNTH